MENLDRLLAKFSEDVCESIYKGTQDLGVRGVGITGSYARGDYSESRPDINFAVFADESTPGLILRLGEIASSLNQKYSEHVNLHPEYHPDRFVYPWGRDKNKLDVFFKIAIFQLKEKDSSMPFGRPGFVVEGHKLSMDLKYGKNHFDVIEINSSNKEVLKGVKYVLPQWAKKIKSAPLAYNLEVDTDLFFNESMTWGKLGIQQYAWVQGMKNGLDYSKDKDRATVFKKIHDKKQLRNFFDIPKEEQELINLVLDARVKFSDWKESKRKAEQTYLASEHLLTYFLENL